MSNVQGSCNAVLHMLPAMYPEISDNFADMHIGHMLEGALYIEAELKMAWVLVKWLKHTSRLFQVHGF